MAMAAKFDLSGAGCTFVPVGGKDGEWAIVTIERDAWFMTGGALVHVTAQPKAGDNTHYLAYDRYDNAQFSLRITRGPGEERAVSEEYSEQESAVAILDASGTQVYHAKGTLGCGA